jgi:hypothetical protein
MFVCDGKVCFSAWFTSIIMSTSCPFSFSSSTKYCKSMGVCVYGSTKKGRSSSSSYTIPRCCLDEVRPHDVCVFKLFTHILLLLYCLLFQSMLGMTIYHTQFHPFQRPHHGEPFELAPHRQFLQACGKLFKTCLMSCYTPVLPLQMLS